MKFGVLITARLKSSRLPLKLLKTINGKSILGYVIERAKTLSNVDAVILCTSTNKQDKPLVDIAMENNVYYFLGSEEDVLLRLKSAADFFSLDYIISITGENPFFCVDHANRLIDRLQKEDIDFMMINGLPIGCAVYGIKSKALSVVCSIKDEIDTEIWGPLLNRPDIFNVCTLSVDEYYNRPNIRLTIDYLEDYALIHAIMSSFEKNSNPSLYEVLQLLDRQPDLLKINSERFQAQLSAEVLQRIDDFYVNNRKKIIDIKQSIYHDSRFN